MTKTLLLAIVTATLVASPAEWVTSAEAVEARVSLTQTPAPQPEPPPPPPAPPPQRAPNAPVPPPQPAGPPPKNVQLDVVITDTISGKPEAKRVTLLLRQGRGGSIRTKGEVSAWSSRSFMMGGSGDARTVQQHVTTPVELALDGNVQLLGQDLVDVNVTFDYAAPPQNVAADSGDPGTSTPAKVTESISVVLRSGRPLLVSRSADPVTNRTVTVELTATIREP